MNEKLDQVLTMLSSIDGRLGSIETRLDRVEDGQSKNLTAMTGALEQLGHDLCKVDNHITEVGHQVSATRQAISQLRAEHGGYLRAIHDNIRGVDRRVTWLEAAD